MRILQDDRISISLGISEVTGGSIRLRILQDRAWLSWQPRAAVTGGSIRLRILQVPGSNPLRRFSDCYRGFDPFEDTARGIW